MSAQNKHVTVMLDEAVAGLSVKPDGIYVDCTFGRGGHSRLILSQLGAGGRLIGFDKDPAAIREATSIEDSRFHIVHAPFLDFSKELDNLGIGGVDGVLMDLGVSSPQLDEAERGFSFRFDAPLDMRMDNSRGQTAADWVNTASEADLTKVIKEYGEERYAKQVASAIVNARSQERIGTTRQLAKVVATAVRSREQGQDPATRTFQAIRIYINRELEELSLVLPQIIGRLNHQGRLSVISFHSLEDRIVKHAFRDAVTVDTLPSRLPIRADQMKPAEAQLIGKAAKPSREEVAVNPRSRSATLRVLEKLGDAHV
ncbi:16S rRNA (cytosine(1402)-N(4))-methyltransferase RsmH [Leeia sp. TBRC 13508]|uniref:Ribosomal RNA small subunit methyltransferase H n=1 Tax=Leeia speluncae TaxID=2884804 RepID=A0ABS8D5J5_9NEIS|nr:16S rRNA (cytosine(1402)-N(4))-methyltransferase RsmH [Leeia speluncae]MCB6183489.1 16S rRNA (cytosine(1402)-N(4))-methyltransferase RsmH [Leeia speluncae]